MSKTRGLWIGLCLVSILLAPNIVRAEDRNLYLMSKPVPMDVQIGTIGKIMHYSYWATEIIFKTGAFYAASHQALPTAGFLMFTLAHSAPYLTAHTMIDIKIRQMLKGSWMVRELRNVPGIERAIVFSSGSLSFDGPLVRGRTSQNYVLVETDEPLDPATEAAWTETFGRPINVSDTMRTRLTFTLVVDGKSHEVEWDAPLVDVLDRKPIPEEVAESWRSQITDWDAQASRTDRMLGKPNRSIQVDAELRLPNGEKIPIDSLISGGQVRKLLGMSLSQRIKDWFIEHMLGGDIVERPVSLDVKRFPMKKCERALLEPVANFH